MDKEVPELNGYHPLVAQDKYEQRRAVHRKMVVDSEPKAVIEDRLKAGWSPEQIAGRMRLGRHPIRVSHETIYRCAYSKDGRAEQFYRHLPEHRKRHRPRGYLPRTTEPTARTTRYLRSICHRLNATPRKCLGYRTPAEVFESELMELRNRLE